MNKTQATFLRLSAPHGGLAHPTNIPSLAIACHHCLRGRWKTFPEAKILTKEEGNERKKPPWPLKYRIKSLLAEINTTGTEYNKQSQTEVKYLLLIFNIPLKQIVKHCLHYLIAFKRLLRTTLMNVSRSSVI